MREYPDNHRRLFDRGDDLQLATTLRAVFKVQVEDALEQACPAHARRSFLGVPGGILAGLLRGARHDCRTQCGIGGEHPVKADQVQARARHQRGQGREDLSAATALTL